MEAITREEKIMSGENLTPITRKEMFLAKAAGQDIETPEPITREEMFLSKIGGGSGGGITPTGTLNITENGEYDVTTFEKASVNVASSGGGGEEWIGDGKTHLWINIAAEGRMTVPLCFSQTVANGVTIDWGDGSAPQTLSGTGNVDTTHTYASIGEYVITLDVAEGCTLGLGHDSSSYCVMGSTAAKGRVYCNMLQKAEIGNGVTSIGGYAFDHCYSLASIVLSNSVTSIGRYAFNFCHSLASIVLSNSVTSIGGYAFNYCYSLASIVLPEGVRRIEASAFYYCESLASIVIPESVTSIGNNAFYYCESLASIVIPKSVTRIEPGVFTGLYGMKIYDFTKHTAVPTLANTNAFTNIPADCEFLVSSALYDEWIAATNWSTYANQVVVR